MIRAAGTVFLSKKTKRMLLNFRSSSVTKPFSWGFWGGKLNTNENIHEGLTREVIEELGFIPEYEAITIIDEYVSQDGLFKYYSFVVIVNEEFIPITNDESAGFAWVNIGEYPRPLHPGATVILENKSIIKSLKKLVNISDNNQ